MKPLQDFENLTIHEIFISILGEKVATELLANIKDRIVNKGDGEDLEEIIHEELCKLKVSSIEIHEILHIVPQITATRQITK